MFQRRHMEKISEVVNLWAKDYNVSRQDVGGLVYHLSHMFGQDSKRFDEKRFRASITYLDYEGIHNLQESEEAHPPYNNPQYLSLLGPLRYRGG